MKKCLMILGLVAINVGVYANGLSPMDSVGVERVGGKTFIIHQVDEKETLFGIARRYEAPMNEIIGNNPVLSEGLKPGQRIKIPFVEKAALPAGAKLHKVGPGETLFSIAKNYQVSVQDVMSWNNLKGNDLSIGQPLIIKGAASAPVAQETKPATPATSPKTTAPAEARKTEEAKPATKPAAATPAPVSSPRSAEPAASKGPGEWITHQVDPGQTLFAIARQYDAKVDDLIEWNGLTSTNLAPGQSLKVGRGGQTAAASTAPESRTNPAAERPSAPANDRPVVESRPSQPTTTASTEPKNIKEMGQAEVIDGTGNHKKYLVLHRTAPVGTIMRIRNEENDITIFARVVGKLPETGDNGRLIIKVSKAAFDQLRAVNNRFPVEISY